MMEVIKRRSPGRKIMHAHAQVIAEPAKTAVYSNFYDHDGILRTVLIRVTTPEHAIRIVQVMNSAPATGNFPAVLAAVGARR
jgi:hypothetical protein